MLAGRALPLLKRNIVFVPLFLPSRREASGAKTTALLGETLCLMHGGLVSTVSLLIVARCYDNNRDI